MTSKKISLTDIGHELINKRIEFLLLPQTISDRRIIPKKIRYICTNPKCGKTIEMNVKPVDFFQGNIKFTKDCPSCENGEMSRSFSKYSNCYVIQAIHPVTDVRIDGAKDIKDKVKIIEESRTIKPILTYYVTDSNDEITFGVLKAKGLVAIDKKKIPFRFFLVANELSPEKDYFLNYKITDGDKQNFKKYFTDNTDLDADIYDTIAPPIVGRDLPKFFSALVQHSVLYIRHNQLGTLSALFGGDSRCAKSVIMLDLIYYLSPVGCEYTTAETATRTGISYTLKQVGDSWEIEWGILPLCDKMLVGLDGLHAWGIEEIQQLREVMSQGVIRVRRVVKANSPARVRRLGSLNFNRKVNTYPTRWHATLDSSILGHVDRNRWDAIFVFGENDISKEEINKRHRLWKEGKIQRKIPADIWRKHIIWVWQLTPDRIKIAAGTYEKIESIVNEIHAKFQDSKIKPFTNEFFNTFEKMTVAYACLCHSVDEDDNLIVKSEHAEVIKEKINEYMNHLELDNVKLMDQFLPLGEVEILLSKLKDTNKETILLYIGNNPGCKQIDIANVLGVKKPYISQELNWFQENHLITGRTNICLSETGAELNRKFLGKKAENKESIVIGEELLEKNGKVKLTNNLTRKGPDLSKIVIKNAPVPIVNKKVNLTLSDSGTINNHKKFDTSPVTKTPSPEKIEMDEFYNNREHLEAYWKASELDPGLSMNEFFKRGR